MSLFTSPSNSELSTSPTPLLYTSPTAQKGRNSGETRDFCWLSFFELRKLQLSMSCLQIVDIVHNSVFPSEFVFTFLCLSLISFKPWESRFFNLTLQFATYSPGSETFT